MTDNYDLEQQKLQPTIAQTMSLGHNMPPISTHYEPAHKNRDGKTFWDLLPELQAPFAPECHKSYELGYSKEHRSKVDYIYLPVGEYEERLNHVVGYGCWLVETIGAWIDESGRPVLRMRLRVLDVIFESNGYAKPRGEWKGSLTEICAADGLKECCERLTGMGKYLKNQDWTIRYIFQNTSDQKLKGEMRRIGGQRSLALSEARASREKVEKDDRGSLLDDLGNNDPVTRRSQAVSTASTTTRKATLAKKPTSQPPKGSAVGGRVELYPQHTELIRSAREKAGVSKEWVKEYLVGNWQGLAPSYLTVAELNVVLKAIALHAYKDRFQDIRACIASYEAKIAILAGDSSSASHYKAYCEWVDQASQLKELVKK